MRAPAHLHVAVRILDRCGVDDAVVGDLLEMYEARPSAVRLWLEVTMAIVARGVSQARENKPQAIRRAATAMAVIGFLAYSMTAWPHVDLASSVRVEDVSGGWLETDAADGATRLLPIVSFQLRNVSSAPLASVQVNVMFRRMRDQAAWSDVFRRAVTSSALASGTSTDAIVVRAPVGYTSDEAATQLLSHSRFVDTAVAIYARHGSDGWTYLGEFQLPRQIVDRNGGPVPIRTPVTYRVR